MAGAWKVSCRMTSHGGSGNANGEFSRMDDALAFADSWLGPGWTGTLTSPTGVRVALERGKKPAFPPGKSSHLD